MMFPVLLSGFLMGLAGSVHCLGMCGPLSWALPIRHVERPTQVRWLTLYQIGRILNYGLLGLIAGSIGTAIEVTGYQQLLSVVIGAAILFFGMATLSPAWSLSFPPMRWLHGQVQSAVQQLWKKPMNGGRMFVLGSLNGWLPCGMVYLAILSALTTRDVWSGGLFLIAFGVGTIPAMMLTSLGGLWVGKEIRFQLRRLVPLMVGMVGIALILRGLSLGIPYISPSAPAEADPNSIHCATTVQR